MKIEKAKMAEFTMEVDIDGTPELAWKSLAADIGLWWPADFYADGESGKRSYFLEARPGGTMGERWDNGGGVIWATVVGVDPKPQERTAETACIDSQCVIKSLKFRQYRN
jgi:hypothetical protein